MKWPRFLGNVTLRSRIIKFPPENLIYSNNEWRESKHGQQYWLPGVKVCKEESNIWDE